MNIYFISRIMCKELLTVLASLCLMCVVQGMSITSADLDPRGHDLAPTDIDLGVCGNSEEAADICLVCHVVKLRDVQSCCTTRDDFDACNERFLELAASRARAGYDVMGGSDDEGALGSLDKRGGHFRSFNRAWYKGKRRGSNGNRVFSKYNRMWYKSGR